MMSLISKSFILFLLSISGLYAQNYYEGDSLYILGTSYQLRHYPEYGSVNVENTQNNFDYTQRYAADDYYCIHVTKSDLAELHQIMREVFTPSQIAEYRQDSASHSFSITFLTDLAGNMLGIAFSLEKDSKVSPSQLRAIEQKVMFRFKLSVHCENFPPPGTTATFMRNSCVLSFRDL